MSETEELDELYGLDEVNREMDELHLRRECERMADSLVKTICYNGKQYWLYEEAGLYSLTELHEKLRELTEARCGKH